MNQSEKFNLMATHGPTPGQMRLGGLHAAWSKRSLLPRSAATTILMVSASLALASGVMVYLSDRPPAHAQWIPAMFAIETVSQFGVLGNWLPSFVHPFAFALMSAALRAPAAVPAYGACVAWWSVNLIFEVSQHPFLRPSVVRGLQSAFGDGWLTRPLSNYFLRGTFDVGDLVAATLGALAAAVLLHVIHKREVSCAHSAASFMQQKTPACSVGGRGSRRHQHPG